MTDEQHVTMLSEVKALKGMVIISGYDNQIYTQGLSDWTTVKRQASAGGGKDGALAREEVLWINPACLHSLNCVKAQTDFDF